jgi:signal transduction histidine kinase
VLKYNFSLSKKLFLFICILLLLIILSFFYIAKTSLAQFGGYAYTVNERQIKKMSRFYLSRIAVEQAKSCEAVFEKIKTASSLLGSQLTSVYDNIDVLSKISSSNKVSNLKLNPENQVFFSPDNEAVITAYWGGAMISDEIQKELNALSHIKPMLMKSKELVNEGLATYVITASGIGQYYNPDQRLKNKVYHLPLTSEFDLRQGQPFTVFTNQKTKYFNTQWTEIYKDDIFDGMIMSATTPVYDQKSEFKGVIGIDTTVEYIVNNLAQGALISEDETENILFAFLQNWQGKIIAFPREFLPLFGLDIDMNHFKNSSDILNYSLTDSSIQAVRRAGQGTRNTHNGIIDLVIDNEKYILAIGCLGSVEWHLVLVAREADMMTSVQKTQLALNKSLRTIWKDLVFHSFLIVVVLVLSALCTIRVFIAPIKQFIQATQKVSKGDFLSRLKIERNDEIGLLAKSFNRMIGKLRMSKQKEEENARELENRIQLRTLELEKSNDELNHIKDELEKTIAKRTAQLRRMNEHLVYSEENERKAIASDLHDSVTQTLALSIFKLKNIRESDKDINEKDFSEVQGYLEQSVREIRSLIYQLSPPILDDFDIEIALGFLIEETNLKYKGQFKYINNIEDTVCLDHAIKITLYRAVNELITNILKHSGSKKGEIEISKNKENIIIQVEDQGAGFDVDIIKDSIASGFGLNSLVERMENLGGKFLMDSTPGKGTKIFLAAPICLERDKKYEKN